jgi:hypothetical protein
MRHNQIVIILSLFAYFFNVLNILYNPRVWTFHNFKWRFNSVIKFKALLYLFTRHAYLSFFSLLFLWWNATATLWLQLRCHPCMNGMCCLFYLWLVITHFLYYIYFYIYYELRDNNKLKLLSNSIYFFILNEGNLYYHIKLYYII